jgi:tripartite-type tricarboxylate transporter receptor subunit TctC
LRTALEDKEVIDRMALNGAFPRYLAPEEATDYIHSQQTNWRPIQEKIAREAE